ncbi:hypothetical protein PRZ48_007320 [Zasmidium cellare]|uniref:Zn(2)-C6 fungal-type domain-containing protein n=1 Tax=Zasmidium cellare TaxID=395010 RepID=A0ABR0EJ06_ZASCE|nr:hypothetical protein PRZ48_007320 [Zasmidium cellare]
MTIPVLRKRAKKPKVKTGCLTCRARHLKCDEGRPACRRCVNSGKECVGLPSLKPPNPSLILPKKNVQVMCYDLISRPSIAALNVSDHDANAYDFFRRHTVKILPGSSWNLSWERLALQAGDHEPSVTHAAIALGSIHRAMGSDEGAMIDPNQYDLALLQYSKAMRRLQTYLKTCGDNWSDASVEVVLLTSLLFFCFELLHNESALATVHLRNGLRILYERTQKRDRLSTSKATVSTQGQMRRTVRMQGTPRSNMDVLMQAFVRLGGDLTTSGEEGPYLSPLYDEKIPSSFLSIDEAMVSLDAIATSAHELCHDIVSLTAKYLTLEREDFWAMDEDMRNCLSSAYSRSINIGAAYETRLQQLKDRLRQWKSACEWLSMSEQRPSGYLLCQIQFFYVWFIVMSRRDASEMLVDRFSGEFDHIVKLAEQYVALHSDGLPGHESEPRSNTNESSGPRPLGRIGHLFTVGTDVVPCIGMIAFKSRDTAVRRRCLNLLKAINLQGVMDSGYLAAFIHIAADFEEDRARAITGKPPGIELVCSEVPEAARLIEIELSPMNFKTERPGAGKANVGRMVYVERRPGLNDLQIGQEVFTVERVEWATGSKGPDGFLSPEQTNANVPDSGLPDVKQAQGNPSILANFSTVRPVKSETEGVHENKSNFGGNKLGQYLNHRKLAGFRDGPSFTELLMFTHRSTGTFGGGQEIKIQDTADENTNGDVSYTLNLAHRGRKSSSPESDMPTMTIDPSSRSLKAIKMVRRQRQAVPVTEVAGAS